MIYDIYDRIQVKVIMFFVCGIPVKMIDQIEMTITINLI